MRKHNYEEAVKNSLVSYIDDKINMADFAGDRAALIEKLNHDLLSEAVAKALQYIEKRDGIDLDNIHVSEKIKSMNFDEKTELLAKYIGVLADAIEKEAPSPFSNFNMGAFRTSEGTYFVLDEAETKSAFICSMTECVEDYGVEYIIEKFGTDSIETAFEVAKEKGKLGDEISCDDYHTYQFAGMYIFRNSRDDERSDEFLKKMFRQDGMVLRSRESSDYGEHEYEIQHIEDPEFYMDCFVVKEDGEYWQKQDREGNDTGVVEILSENELEFLLLEERLESRYGSDIDRLLSFISEIPPEKLIVAAARQGYTLSADDIKKIIRDTEKQTAYEMN